MILVILGTQDKEFPRLLQAIEKEIQKGTIKDKVVVQAGQTKYESNCMEIFDLLPGPEFDKLMDQADLIITHGGAGSILSAIKKGKKIIATPRLAKYKEHHNDHQKQIIGEFAKQGYILELNDFQKLDKVIEKSKSFKPKKFESNTPRMMKLLNQYIEEDNHTAWFHKCYPFLVDLFNVSCLAIINIIAFSLLRLTKMDLYLYNIIASIITMVLGLMYVFIKKYNFRHFLGYGSLSICLDMGLLYVLVGMLSINQILAKVIIYFVILFIYCLLKRLFNKKG